MQLGKLEDLGEIPDGTILVSVDAFRLYPSISNVEDVKIIRK